MSGLQFPEVEVQFLEVGSPKFKFHVQLPTAVSLSQKLHLEDEDSGFSPYEGGLEAEEKEGRLFVSIYRNQESKSIADCLLLPHTITSNKLN